ncbi:MAG: hypothetical protein HYY01_03520 [Chloroflexi bacterium]|nr:hypothetical protein [Chloroflexota bacterium]
MPKHLWVLACLWVAYGAGVASLATAAGLWYYSSNASSPVAVELVAIAAVALLGVVGGVALLGGQRWARALLVAVAVPNLAVFPVGTALGAYTFWAFLRVKA